MLLSAVSVLVVTQPISEVPERLMNYPLFNLFHIFLLYVKLAKVFFLFSFSPTYALIYIIKILSQAVMLIAHFTPTCFDPYGSSSGSTAGRC